MILFKLILIILSINFINCQSTCQNCLIKGNQCSSSSSVCRDGLKCGTPANEDKEFVEKICIETTGVNSVCFDDSNCDIGLTCIKSNTNDTKGQCLNAYFALIGESCQSTLECYSEYSECQNNICTRVKEGCQSLARKSDEDSNCEDKKYCSNNVCVSPVPIGGQCSGNDVRECNSLIGFCDKTSLTCKNFYSLQINEPCSSSTSCDYTKNLICDFGTCQVNNKYVKPNVEGCMQTSDCNKNLINNTNGFNPYLSNCNCLTGECYQKYYDSNKDIEIETSFKNCLNQYNCSDSYDGLYNENGCGRKNCGEQFCSYVSLEKDTNRCNTWGKFIDQVCGTNSSIKLSIPSLQLILLILSIFYIIF